MDMTKCTVTSSRPFEEKEKLRCMFCRGGNCNRCGETAYLSLVNPAIDKLHSTWVDDSILAMQRPNDVLMKESNLIEQFKLNGIVAVFNLTEPGEHPYCGGGNLKESGFPYHPEKLMASGIKHFNYAWPDMTAPSMNLMKDIVRVACNEIIQGGKIAVHCHAGYGRTGIAIASILIALRGMTAHHVIKQIRERRPGSIQTKKQKQFVHDFERCHWEALQVYSNEDIGAASAAAAAAAAAAAVDKKEATVGPESPDNVSSYASSLTTSPISHTKSMGDVNSTSTTTSKKSPRTLRKVLSRNSLDSDASQDTSKQSYSQNSIDGRSSSIDKDSQTPRTSINDTCIMSAKSISQSLRDQQYSLPVHELNHFQFQSNFSKCSIGAGYQGLSHGTLDLHWNHKCVLICANVLKESCSLTRISFEIIDNIRQNLGPGSMSAAHISALRRQQSVENLILIGKSMTGLSVNTKGELEIIPNDVTQLAQNLLNCVNDDHDDNSDNGYPTDKKHENSMTRLKKFKSEINKGIWDRLHSAFEILFLISYDPEGTKSLRTSEKKRIDENKRIDTLNSELSSQLSYIPENEILNRKESIAVICDLFLDFIDSRADTIFDENLCKKLLIAWNDGSKKQKSDVFNKSDENSLAMNINESNDTVSSSSSSTSKAITNCEELKKKNNNIFSEKMLSSVNEILRNEKLERPKLSLLQQLVNILQSLHKVIESPKKKFDMTNDEEKSAEEDKDDDDDDDDKDEKDSSLTMEDRIEVKRHYKLICYRLAISCSLKLRKHRLSCAESGENGRSFLALSKVVLQNFDMEGLSPHTNHLCAPTQSAQTPYVTGVFDVDISTYPSNFISTSEGEDIPYILMLMSTLHLLAKGSWTHHDLLPNRLRINRKLQG